MTGCEKRELPVTHSLTDINKNTLIPVQITGRTQTHVEFIRLKDSKFFSYPISKLSLDDQKFVRSLAVMQTKTVLKEPPYIQSRLDHIAKLKKDIKRIQLEIKNNNKASKTKAGSSPFKEASITPYNRHDELIANKKNEIAELESDIEMYRLDH